MLVFLVIVGSLMCPLIAAAQTSGLGEQAMTLASGLPTPTRLMVRDGFVHWLDGNSETGVRVHRVAVSGGDATLLSSGGSYTGTGIAVDTASIYWSASPGGGSGFVFKAPLSGGLAVQLTTDRVNQPSDIAIDSEFLYWAEDNGGPDQNQGIRKVSLNGGSSITVTTLGYPLSLVLLWPDVYYSYTKTGGGSFIGKVNMNGGSITDLASTNSRASGMVIDATHVYWAEFDTGTIKKMPLGGGPVTTLASGLNQPWRLAVDGFNVYWVEWANASPGAGAVRKTSLSGGEITTLATGLNGPNDIAVDSTAVYWSEYGTNRSDGAIKKLVLVDEVVPVVLVHGWGGDSETFGQMKDLLEKPEHGGFTVKVFDYTNETSCSTEGVTINHIAGKFQRWLGDQEDLRGKQIDVVAHSMGGLVVRSYMAGMGIGPDGSTVSYGNEVRKLVLIATPNYGVTAGVVGGFLMNYRCLGTNLSLSTASIASQALEMQNGSPFLRTLWDRWPRVNLLAHNTLDIAGTKGSIVPILLNLHCTDFASNEGDDDGVVNIDSARLSGADHYREVPYKHANLSSLLLCPSDTPAIAYIDSPNHLTFRTLVEFLQEHSVPTLHIRSRPGGIWRSVVSLLSFREMTSRIETQSAEDLTWAEVPGGGLTPLSPAVAAAPNGDVYVVVQGVDNHIYLNIQRNGTWLGWTPHPSGRTGSSPAAVVDVNGNLQVFVHGVDDAIYQTTYSGGSWSEWAEVPGGGFTFSAPETAVNRVTGELTLLVRGIDSQIYLNTYRGATWSGWSAVPVGGLTLSELGATYDASGTLWLFARGIDAGIWVTSRSGGRWSGWTGLGGTTPSGLAAVASGNTVVVFAHGSDDRIYHNSYSNGQWGGWNEAPGYGLTKDAPAATVDSQGNVLLFVRGM